MYCQPVNLSSTSNLCFFNLKDPSSSKDMVDQIQVKFLSVFSAGLDFAIAYMDNIIAVSKSAGEHAQHLLLLFQTIADYGCKVRMEKCSFFQSSIKYLEQMIDKDGRRPDPAKIEAMVKMPLPNVVPTLLSI
uniref:Reverse transcriptase domain-containing protein n=1 Tax=Ditylenchus dipsaci TaxID=166011 RepID=A0A915EUJ9_9BILA